MDTRYYGFKKAVPVWNEELRGEMNVSLSFVCDIEISGDETNARLALAAADSYILRINGILISYGPARSAKGFYRVDEIDILPHLTKGKNTVAIRVAAYNTNSFFVSQSLGFLCAEIEVDGKVVAATGDDVFCAYRVVQRIQKVNRYSFQRPFAEFYELADGAFDYEIGSTDARRIDLSATEPKTFIRRGAPYGEFPRIYPERVNARGIVSRRDISENEYYHCRFLDRINQQVKGYELSKLEHSGYRDISELFFDKTDEVDESAGLISLASDSFAMLDFKSDVTGIFAFELESEGDGEFYIIFDELLDDNGDINPFRLQCVNLIAFRVKRGKYSFVCAEPYTFKHVKLVSRGISVRVSDLHCIGVVHPRSNITARFVKDDAEMKQIFDAAVETFSANAVDIYMDCPSRERSGWLCDSYFTSRAEHVLTGKSLVERDFLENFILPDFHEGHPKGMIPMCYPGDMVSEQFIPNWAMFYVLELEEYLHRSGDDEFVRNVKDKIYDLLAYFKRFENEYGLLESLESWVFVEWSHANKLVQDVSFPTNMLYARFKAAIGNLYGDAQLIEEAAALRKTIEKMSFTGEFFCDNAYRRNGELVLSGEYTETCQYYAFYFDIATPDKYPELWNTLLSDFGYSRRKTGKYPDVHFSNAFIGNQMRLDLICRYGEYELLDRNIRDYYGYMARTTGTLWEYENSTASCNHGFGSELVCWLKALGYVE